MHSSRKRSLKRNKGRRKSFFQPGHPQLFHKKSAKVTFSDSTETTDTTLTSRINTFELPDVMSLATTSTQSNQSGVINYRLRPAKDTHYCEKNLSEKSDLSAANENIIVNIKKLEDLFCAFLHNCEASDCNSVSINIVKRQGLCTSVVVKCKSCGYETPQTGLYTTIKSEKGPQAGCLNTMLLLPVLKSRVGLNDLNMMLSCLNIKSPDKRGLQRKLNKLTDKAEELNKQQMVENQQYVKRIQTFAGVSNQSDVEFDVSYSSRPQQGCERATQSFAPVIEQMTTRHLPISLETASKLCTKQNCEHATDMCKRNYNPNESIQSSESKLLKKNLESVHKQNIIKVRSVTTDASTQIAKALREYNTMGNLSIQHFKCFIHRMRTLYGQLKSVKLTSVPKEYDKAVYSQKLASSLRARARLELTRYRKRFSNDNLYVQHARSCMENIVSCFQGKHG